jgi:hypothetical protein
MNIALFMILLAIFCVVSMLFTEAFKNLFKNAGKPYSANLIALAVSAIVGGGGSTAAFILLSIPFTAVNITCIILLVAAVWLGAMVGYDKLYQSVTQIIEIMAKGKIDLPEIEEKTE